jgi:hypothetical protein
LFRHIELLLGFLTALVADFNFHSSLKRLTEGWLRRQIQGCNARDFAN